MRRILSKMLISIFIIGFVFTDSVIAEELLFNKTKLKQKIFNSLSCDMIIKTGIYESCYMFKHKGTKAVVYTLDGALVNKHNIKRRYSWKIDKNIPEEYRSSTVNYPKGYDRGHLAFDSGFDYSNEAVEETYILGVNSIPQVAYVNRYIWSKAEIYARRSASIFGKVNVIDVIKYDNNNTKTDDGVTIPTGMYKMIYVNNFKQCFYYPNMYTCRSCSDTVYGHSYSCYRLLKDIENGEL